MELVQSSQVIQQRLQRLRDGEELQEAMDDDVEDGQEAQADVAEVDRQVLRLQLQGRAHLFRKTLKVQLLGVFLEMKRRFFHVKLLSHIQFWPTVRKQRDRLQTVAKWKERDFYKFRYITFKTFGNLFPTP